MKTKKILFAIAFAAVTFLSSYIFTHNNNEIKLSDLALANVEALADNNTGEILNPGDDTSCKWRTEDHGSVWLAVCDTYGVGYVCECGKIKEC